MSASTILLLAVYLLGGVTIYAALRLDQPTRDRWHAHILVVAAVWPIWAVLLCVFLLVDAVEWAVRRLLRWLRGMRGRLL